MTVKSPQAFDEDIPPVPTLKFHKRTTVVASESQNQTSNSAKAAARPKDKSRTASKQTANRPKPDPRVEQQIYIGYSTQLRCDLQRQLKRLKHEREEARHPVRTIKQFLEVALTARLATVDEASTSSKELATGEVSYSPFRTEIRRDLLRQVKKWKYEQEEIGNRNASIKSFLEAAISLWLASQVSNNQVAVATINQDKRHVR